jgi:hypothetical protein
LRAGAGGVELRGEESVIDGVGRAEQRTGVGLDRDWKHDDWACRCGQRNVRAKQECNYIPF